MREALAEFLARFLSADGVTFILSMLPVSELRGAMIYAAAVDIPLTRALAI